MIPRMGSALIAPLPLSARASCRGPVLLRSLVLAAPGRRYASQSNSPSSPASSPKDRAGASRPQPKPSVRTDVLSRASNQSASSDVVPDGANPPKSTLPAPVDVPARKPDESTFSYALSAGKLYLSFYKTGVKNIWNNRKEASALKGGLHEYATAKKTTVRALLKSPDMPLTRGEWQLIRRSKDSMRRVPVFALLFAIIGEWLPVVAVFVTALVPVPCRIPKQIEKELRKHEEQRRSGQEEFRNAAGKLGLNLHKQDLDTLSTKLAELHRHVSSSSAVRSVFMNFAVSSFNTRASFWDRWGLHRVAPQIPWYVITQKHLDYLALDDRLLQRDGGVKALRGDEVQVACAERGINVLNRPEKDLRTDLQLWLERKKGLEWSRVHRMGKQAESQ